MPEGGCGEGGPGAFTEQVTFSQRFERGEDESLSYLEEENGRQKDSLYDSPEAGRAWWVCQRNGEEAESGTERGAVVGAEVREISSDGPLGACTLL